MIKDKKMQLFVQISQGLGLLLTLIGSFLGSFYWLEGSVLFAGFISILSVAAMYLLIQQFCEAKRNRSRSGYKPLTILFFGIYAIISIVVSFLVLHFYHVEFLEKENIKSQGILKVNGLHSIYNSFETKAGDWCEGWKLDLAATVSDIKNHINESSGRQQLKEKPYGFTVKEINDLVVKEGTASTKNINELHKELKQVFKDSLNTLIGDSNYFATKLIVFNQWDRMALISTLMDLETRVKNDYLHLQNILKNQTYEEEGSLDISIAPLTNTTLISSPIELAKKHKGLMTILVLLGFQLLILLPFLLTPGRSFGN